MSPKPDIVKEKTRQPGPRKRQGPSTARRIRGFVEGPGRVIGAGLVVFGFAEQGLEQFTQQELDEHYKSLSSGQKTLALQHIPGVSGKAEKKPAAYINGEASSQHQPHYTQGEQRSTISGAGHVSNAPGKGESVLDATFGEENRILQEDRENQFPVLSQTAANARAAIASSVLFRDGGFRSELANAAAKAADKGLSALDALRLKSQNGGEPPTMGDQITHKVCDPCSQIQSNAGCMTVEVGGGWDKSIFGFDKDNRHCVRPCSNDDNPGCLRDLVTCDAQGNPDFNGRLFHNSAVTQVSDSESGCAPCSINPGPPAHWVNEEGCENPESGAAAAPVQPAKPTKVPPKPTKAPTPTDVPPAEPASVDVSDSAQEESAKQAFIRPCSPEAIGQGCEDVVLKTAVHGAEPGDVACVLDVPGPESVYCGDSGPSIIATFQDSDLERPAPGQSVGPAQEQSVPASSQPAETTYTTGADDETLGKALKIGLGATSLVGLSALALWLHNRNKGTTFHQTASNLFQGRLQQHNTITGALRNNQPAPANAPDAPYKPAKWIKDLKTNPPAIPPKHDRKPVTQLELTYKPNPLLQQGRIDLVRLASGDVDFLVSTRTPIEQTITGAMVRFGEVFRDDGSGTRDYRRAIPAVHKTLPIVTDLEEDDQGITAGEAVWEKTAAEILSGHIGHPTVLHNAIELDKKGNITQVELISELIPGEVLGDFLAAIKKPDRFEEALIQLIQMRKRYTELAVLRDPRILGNPRLRGVARLESDYDLALTDSNDNNWMVRLPNKELFLVDVDSIVVRRKRDGAIRILPGLNANGEITAEPVRVRVCPPGAPWEYYESMRRVHDNSSVFSIGVRAAELFLAEPDFFSPLSQRLTAVNQQFARPLTWDIVADMLSADKVKAALDGIYSRKLAEKIGQFIQSSIQVKPEDRMSPEMQFHALNQLLLDISTALGEPKMVAKVE